MDMVPAAGAGFGCVAGGEVGSAGADGILAASGVCLALLRAGLMAVFLNCC